MNEYWIQFAAPVNQMTAAQFINVITECLNSGATKLNILISTPGGTVIHGKSIFNFLKSLPLEIDIYNIGQVDSIGGVMYLAGTKRYAVENSSFLIHGISLMAEGRIDLPEKLLQEKLEALKKDRESISSIYAENTSIGLADFEKLMLDGTTISANEAIIKGIVTEIKAPLIPNGVKLISITG